MHCLCVLQAPDALPRGFCSARLATLAATLKGKKGKVADKVMKLLQAGGVQAACTDGDFHISLYVYVLMLQRAWLNELKGAMPTLLHSTMRRIPRQYSDGKLDAFSVKETPALVTVLRGYIDRAFDNTERLTRLDKAIDALWSAPAACTVVKDMILANCHAWAGSDAVTGEIRATFVQIAKCG